MDTRIFATRLDLIPRIEWIESQKELHYATDSGKEILFYNSIKDLSEIGINKTGQYISGIQFLVVEKKYKINVEIVRTYKGSDSFNIGQLKNPNSIFFQPGGIYNKEYLIRGNIGTVSESKESKELFKYFSKGITKGFTKIRGWYVGPDALRLMNLGIRLITMHVKENPNYDLVKRM